jgi:hypothetical protein
MASRPVTDHARHEGCVSEQMAHGQEISVVDKLGAGCDEALNRPVARFSIRGPVQRRA